MHTSLQANLKLSQLISRFLPFLVPYCTKGLKNPETGAGEYVHDVSVVAQLISICNTSASSYNILIKAH